ncbi:MAG TPA: sigma-70 family RNA polymerase sigma factor [Gemmataceae bacterium]|nr:sigma-70 family RNA polymerase sigma factor [Gemmataceae bacterium]
MPESPFAAFVARIRAGDESAAAELVRQYEPFIRREVRMSLQDRRLNRVFDSMDVCQSVLASFFVRTAAGAYDLDDPQQLLGLLVTMARNKLASAARRQYRQQRDARRTAADGGAVDRAADDLPSPSRQVAGRELLDQFRARLTDEERAIAGLRADGVAWADIAGRLGGTAQGRRMQLARAVERVERELGLGDGDG